jgi:hypothetical protein
VLCGAGPSWRAGEKKGADGVDGARRSARGVRGQGRRRKGKRKGEEKEEGKGEKEKEKKKRKRKIKRGKIREEK